MSDYLSSLGYPFRGRPMVFAFAVLIVCTVWVCILSLFSGGTHFYNLVCV